MQHKEINFQHKLDKVLDPERYVNSGTSQQSVMAVKQQDITGPKTMSLLSNEQVDLYFWSSHISNVKKSSPLILLNKKP